MDAGTDAPDASSGGSAGGADTGGSGGNPEGGVDVGTSGAPISDASGTISLVIPASALLGDTAFTFTPVTAIDNLPSDPSKFKIVRY